MGNVTVAHATSKKKENPTGTPPNRISTVAFGCVRALVRRWAVVWLFAGAMGTSRIRLSQTHMPGSTVSPPNT